MDRSFPVSLLDRSIQGPGHFFPSDQNRHSPFAAAEWRTVRRAREGWDIPEWNAQDAILE
jgi:hypothetical protein